MTKKLALLFLVGITLASCANQEEIQVYNMQLGSEIVAAIYEYQEANSSFPESLSLLAPAFIDEIPIAHSGEEFFYNPDVMGFILSFSVTRNFGCGYSDWAKEWECGYGAE